MSAEWLLPVLYAALMLTALLIYAILDGYDLGVGLLLPLGNEAQRDQMIASIGPFWDANETWLVLGVGLLLIAFPNAYSQIMSALYLPVLLLLTGLILRGVAFDFRAKVPSHRKRTWDALFWLGSILATTAQGYMLGKFVAGFEQGLVAELFAALSALCVAAAYAFIGGSWLVMKTSGPLQLRVVKWLKRTLWLTILGVAAVSIFNPLMSEHVFTRWFSLPEAIVLAPIPLLCTLALWGTQYFLHHFHALPLREQGNPDSGHRADWLPFAAAVLVFTLCCQGLAYSFYPYILPFELTIWDAAAATESLQFLGIGILIVLPAIVAYTILSYRVFWGKSRELTYH